MTTRYKPFAVGHLLVVQTQPGGGDSQPISLHDSAHARQQQDKQYMQLPPCAMLTSCAISAALLGSTRCTSLARSARPWAAALLSPDTSNACRAAWQTHVQGKRAYCSRASQAGNGFCLLSNTSMEDGKQGCQDPNAYVLEASSSAPR